MMESMVSNGVNGVSHFTCFNLTAKMFMQRVGFQNVHDS